MRRENLGVIAQRIVAAGVVAGALLVPTILAGSELRLSNRSLRFSELDGSASDKDGIVDGTLTLDRLEIGDHAEIVVDRATARFEVSHELELFGRSSIRPASSLGPEGPHVEIHAGSIRLLGNASLRADGRSRGGSIRLCAGGDVEVGDRARISARALDGSGPGGTIQLEAAGRLALRALAVLVSASGGSGGSVTLVSCAKDGSRRGPAASVAAIYVGGHVDATGLSGAGGSVELQARQGGVEFPATKVPLLNARGRTTPGTVSIVAAGRVTPPSPSSQPGADVVSGSPSAAPCQCSTIAAPGSTVVAIEADPTTGVPGTTFQLAGRTVQSAAEIQDWHWTLSDGRELAGRTVSVSFAAPGVYGVQLTATDQGGHVGQAEATLQVFDVSTQAPPELGLPKQVGDVDGDGLITLRDAHRVAKHAGSLESLSEAEAPAADVDLDGEVTPGDARLIGQAVAAGDPLPTVLLPDHGAPGARINLIAPELLDPVATIQIEVGNSAYVQQPLRPARGYATFMIPLDATQRASLQVTPGTVEIRILRDGTTAATLPFRIESPPPLPADPKAELGTLLQDQVNLLDLNREAVRELLDLAGVPGADQEILLASFTVSREDLLAEVNRLASVLAGPDGDQLAQVFFLLADANGFPAYRQRLTDFLANDGAALHAQLQERLADGKALSVDEILKVICFVKKASELLDTGGEILGWGCDAMLVGALATAAIPGVDAAALFTWAAACGTVEANLELALTVNSLVSGLDADLRFKATPTNPQAGEPVELRAEIEVLGADDICNFTVGQGRDKLIEKLAKAAVKRYLNKKLLGRAVNWAVGTVSKKLLDELEKRLAGAVARAVGDTEIADALERLSSQVCNLLRLGVPLLDDLSRTLRGPDPNVGTLTFNADGTARYSCPIQSSGSADTVAFTASHNICGENVQKKLTVSCKSRPVTITMGDNGTANDDIFEVRIEGKTVLTSSTPVRSISTTVNLTAGDHVVEMIGRAAPDGIGTYFIDFSGATVIGGDPLSGTDLTPGVVKTFIIRVQ